MDSEAADSAEQAARRKAGLDRPGAGGAADSAAPAAPAGGRPVVEADVESIHGDAPGAADAEKPPAGGERARGVEG